MILEMSGKAKWLQHVETFRSMPENTNRPDTIRQLFVEGMWRELDELFDPEETIQIITTAATDNGYIRNHNKNHLMGIGTPSRAWAKNEYIPHKNARTTDTLDNTQNVTALNEEETHQLNHWLIALETSPITKTAKKQYQLAAAVYRVTGDPTVILSQRATVAGAKVNKKSVTKNWLQGEKHGLSSVFSGVSIEDSQAINLSIVSSPVASPQTYTSLDPLSTTNMYDMNTDKSKARSAEITLNLEIYPTTPVAAPVDLDTLDDALNNIRGYIKYRRHKNKVEKKQWLADNDITTSNEPQPVKPVRIECNPDVHRKSKQAQSERRAETRLQAIKKEYKTATLVSTSPEAKNQPQTRLQQAQRVPPDLANKFVEDFKRQFPQLDWGEET